MFWRTLVAVADLAAITGRFDALKTVLDERSRRLLAAAESQAIGKGGISLVSKATGISRAVIRQGLAELKQPTKLAPGRVRKEGGGRKRAIDKDLSLKTDLESLLESTTRGDPQAALQWTCKSVRQLTAELKRMKHQISHQVVADLLHELGYSLQANRKTKEGSDHPDRNAQFEHLNGKVKWSLGRRQPVISVDTKKKELVGDYKNGGRELRPKGQPETVRVHDFVDPELGRATPYQIYDLGHNSGWVSVGMNHDTAEFAVETIRRWWRTMGRPAYPEATRPADHRRRRRRQWFALADLESRTAKAGQRNRATYRGMSFPAGNQRVEQDRTPSVLLHHPRLAWKASPQLSDNRQFDCGDHHQNGSQDSC